MDATVVALAGVIVAREAIGLVRYVSEKRNGKVKTEEEVLRSLTRINHQLRELTQELQKLKEG